MTALILLLLLFAYVIPLVLITLFSLLTCAHLHRPSLASNQQSDDNKIRATRMLCAVCVAFAISWTLYYVRLLIGLFAPSTLEQRQLEALFALSSMLAFSGSCVNPIIYSFASTEFREHFHDAVLCCRGGSPASAPTRTRNELTARTAC